MASLRNTTELCWLQVQNQSRFNDYLTTSGENIILFSCSWLDYILCLKCLTVCVVSPCRKGFSRGRIRRSRSKEANRDPVGVSVGQGPQKGPGNFVSTHDTEQAVSPLLHRTLPYPPGRKDLHAEAQRLPRHLQGRSQESNTYVWWLQVIVVQNLNQKRPACEDYKCWAIVWM